MLKQRIFTLIACTIPFIVLLIAEVTLRLTGYGQTVPVFVPANSPEGYVTPNRELIKRFFHNNALTPNVSPDTYFFELEKPADTLRIVLMGGSTAAGFPYGRFGSPAGLLSHQLRALYPQHNIDVIPVAMASINSYALRDIAQEVVEISPDAVLIYAGHNEYLGVMGVGSAFANQGSHFTNLLFLALKDLRLFQLMQTLINTSSSKSEANANGAPRSTMAIMAKEQRIPFDSALYNEGLRQFSRNLSATLDTFTAAEIPVFLANLVSNEKDQLPFASTDPDNFPGINPVLNNRMANTAKLSQISAWQNDYPSSANLAFVQAQILLQLQQNTQSRHSFQQARDFDELRFRAPSAFNSIINEYTTQEMVHTVDVEQWIRQDTEDNIVGSKHMLEHLHPNARGYFLIADAFLHELVKNGIVPQPSFPLEKTVRQRWQQVPLSDVDKQVARYKIDNLMSDYPFTQTKRTVPLPSPTDPLTSMALQRIKGEGWLEQQNPLLTYYQEQKNWLQAGNVAALLFESLPTNFDSARIAANLYLRAKQPRLAWYYARKALLLAPNNTDIMLVLAQAQYRSHADDTAAQTLRELLKIDPQHEQAKIYLNGLEGS